MRPTRPSSRSGAFTLVEVFVVMVIIAIMVAIVIPSASTTGNQAVSAARMVTGDLQFAQDTAIATQQPTTVTFNVSGNQYSLSNQSGTLINPITKASYIVSFGAAKGFESLKIAAAAFGGGPVSTVTFDATGAPDNSGTVTVQAGKHKYQMTVAAATGSVTVTGQ